MHPHADLHESVVAWYDEHARDLPWREPGATPWGVMVSEFMLQQTPVARVLPVWSAWLERWPEPEDQAASTAGEAVRAWGRLGYPRRALRLHAAAVAITADHAGQVPSDLAELRALPGVGEYTAAAIAAFAYRRHAVVLDTNVRRVLARLCVGHELPAPALTAAERRLGSTLLPEDGGQAANWSVAVMELGALVCTASSPSCERCPVKALCAWQAAGRPSYAGPPRPTQSYSGTDRQCRGRLLDVVRNQDTPVRRTQLDQAWPLSEQRERCLLTLVADGLLVEVHDDVFALPGG